MLVTEPMECGRLLGIVSEAVGGGVGLVQLRDRGLQPDELAETALAVKAAVGDALLLVNGDTRGATLCGADGVHLPEAGPAPAAIRGAAGREILVGRSVHSVKAALLAAAEGVDYIVAGTIFASASHPDRAGTGIGFLREVCGAVTVPVLAIGGITPEHVAECIEAGAAGVAVISGILHAPDPREAAARYRAELAKAAREYDGTGS